MHVLLGNPFRSNDGTVPKIRAALAKYGIDADPPNFSVHRTLRHPQVSKRGAAMTPGWNVSTQESRLRSRDACYVLFDRLGRLVFQGRLTFEELESRLKALL